MDRQSGTGTAEALTPREAAERFVWLGGATYARLEGESLVMRAEGRPEFTVKPEHKERLIALLRLPRKPPPCAHGQASETCPECAATRGAA
jgi:hypothetical protein